MRELSGLDSDEELWARWLSCPWVRAFESGHCSVEAFAAGVVAEWRLDLSPVAFLEEFVTWPQGPYAGADELVAQVQAVLPAGFLSNMNALQWQARYEDLPLTQAFEHRFLSFELGMVKPDPALFAAVADRLPVPAELILFVDDNAVNVEAGRAAGFQARQVRGIDDVRHELVRAGILEG